MMKTAQTQILAGRIKKLYLEYCKGTMHRNGQKIISCYPQFSGLKFPCDSRGGLRFAVRRRLAELLDVNVGHTIEK